VAHAMAIESPRIVADVIEVQEFPHLAQAYQVSTVPKTVVNDTFEFAGTVTEEQFVTQVLRSVGVEAKKDNPEEIDGEPTTVT